jgi:hypothetical protein
MDRIFLTHLLEIDFGVGAHVAEVFRSLSVERIWKR